MPCGDSVVTAVHEGIEADVRFIQLESEPTSQSLDRRRTGHYRRRAGVGSASKTVYPRQPSLQRRMIKACRPRLPARPSPPPNDLQERADHLRDQTKGLVLPESHPVAVSIPKLGVQSRLVDLGLDADGAMEVPQDPAGAGWFSGGPAPGALGPAVIAGHVTWNGAPAVFHRLGTMRRGDQVTVTRKDGKTAVFTVTRVARFSKSRFPSRAVYGPIDHAGLRLITCGGTYDAARHSYLDNVVVFARLEAVRGPGS